MIPQIIKRKKILQKTKSHGSPCDFTINHKETTSHGAHDINLCTMTKLRNYIPH